MTFANKENCLAMTSRGTSGIDSSTLPLNLSSVKEKPVLKNQKSIMI